MNRALLPLHTSLVRAGELVQLPTWNRLGPRRNVTCQIHHADCAPLALASRLAASRVRSFDVCNDGGGVHTCVQAASGLCTLRLWLQRNLQKKRLCWPAPATQSDAVSTSPSDVQQTPRIFPLWAACITHPLPVAAGGPAGQVDVASFFSLPCDASPGLRPAWMRFDISQGVVRHLVSPACACFAALACAGSDGRRQCQGTASIVSKFTAMAWSVRRTLRSSRTTRRPLPMSEPRLRPEPVLVV